MVLADGEHIQPDFIGALDAFEEQAHRIGGGGGRAVGHAVVVHADSGEAVDSYFHEFSCWAGQRALEAIL